MNQKKCQQARACKPKETLTSKSTKTRRDIDEQRNTNKSQPKSTMHKTSQNTSHKKKLL
jgi:hypothetical protein